MKRFTFLALISSLILCISPQLTSQTDQRMEREYVLAIHGGAGTIKEKNMSAEKKKKYEKKLKQALKAGYKVLKKGGKSVDAVQKAIVILENSPLFNAGKGAVFTSKGNNEMDASIMKGKNLKAGAVAAATRIKNPIKGARAVLEHSPHVMLAGKGANSFAKKQDLDLVSPEYFKTKKRWKQYKKAKKRHKKKKEREEETDKGQGLIISEEQEKWGTVGAVALDKSGNLAAGTSTGGLTYKRFGRIGDSPTIGAGTYAKNKSCAVSCTGHGEYFMRQVAAYQVSALMEFKGMKLQNATHQVIMEALKNMGGAGGLIAVDHSGNVAMPFNTPGMFRGWVKPDGEVKIAMFEDQKITPQ